MLMKPLRIVEGDKPVSYACAHWRTWPPPAMKVGLTPEELRAGGDVNEVQYQRIKVWERVCNLLEMEIEKCRTCPHVRRLDVRDHVPVLVSMDGSIVTPAVDIPTFEALPKNRVNPHQQALATTGTQEAAWLQQANRAKKDKG